MYLRESLKLVSIPRNPSQFPLLCPSLSPFRDLPKPLNMKKHWSYPGVVPPYEVSLPRQRNLSRDEEAASGTSHRDSVAFLYSQIRTLVAAESWNQVQRLTLTAVNRLISEELHRRRLYEYQTLTYEMRLELALRQAILKPEVFFSLSQLGNPLRSAEDLKRHIAVFCAFLRSIQRSELHFEPFLSQVSADSTLWETDPTVRFLNRDMTAVLSS